MGDITISQQKGRSERDMCAMWVMRAFAHKACNGDPKSSYKFIYDACNDIIGDSKFNYLDFMQCAPRYGIDPRRIQDMENDCISADNEFYKSHL